MSSDLLIFESYLYQSLNLYMLFQTDFKACSVDLAGPYMGINDHVISNMFCIYYYLNQPVIVKCYISDLKMGDAMKEKSKFLGTLTADEKAVDAGGNATKRDDYYEKKGEA